QQFLGDWRRVQFDELPQARGRLGPGQRSVRDAEGSRRLLARGLGRAPSQGRRPLLDRGRAQSLRSRGLTRLAASSILGKKRRRAGASRLLLCPSRLSGKLIEITAIEG